MDAAITVSEEIGQAVSDIVRTAADALSVVVRAINEELTTHVRTVGSIVSTELVYLIDDTIGFLNDEWPLINQTIYAIDAWITDVARREAVRAENVLTDFDRLIDNLLSDFENQLTAIDELVGSNYDARMFAVYGEIANFSKAIGASPDYLEGVIQNARSFVMSVSCSSGIAYYEFLESWDIGVNNLLSSIANNTPLYKANPQYIKVAVEQGLIRPVFAICANKYQIRQQATSDLKGRIDDLRASVDDSHERVGELATRLDNMYEFDIAPRLREVSAAFDAWRQDVYNIDRQIVDMRMLDMLKEISSAVWSISDIFSLLNYGGDLLTRIDSLADPLRIEQEEIITDVVTRRFRSLSDDWSEVVEQRKG